MESKKFIKKRALATLSAQENIAGGWVWPFKTVAEWNTSITAFDVQETATTDAFTAMKSMQGTVDMVLRTLHDTTVKVLGLLRTVVEITGPENVHLVKLLSASADSRAEIISEAQDLASAWKRINAAWIPVTGMTLAAFETQVGDASEALKEYLSTQTNWRAENGKWNSIAEALNRDCVGWYSDATHVFPAGTPQGDMIRTTVPTTTELTPYPDQAQVVLNESPGAGAYSITLSAERATKFDVYQKGPTDTDYVKVGVDVLPGVFEQSGLAAGEYLVKAAPMNARGTGPESEPLSIVVS